jgi:hypothetical protein
LYRLALNTSILNKNLDPDTKNSHTDYTSLTTGFVNQNLTETEIADNIGKGFSICCSTIKADSDGKTYRKADNWVGSELIGIDIDNGLTIKDCLKLEKTKFALLLYTTASHTEESNRFRLIFNLPYFEEDKNTYKAIIQSFVKSYNSDNKAASVVTAFYGNSEADIYLIQSKQILKYRNGILVDPVIIKQEVSTVINSEIFMEEPSSNQLPANWSVVNYLNGKTYYVPNPDVKGLYNYYKSAGIYIQDIRPIHYDEDTNVITYVDDMQWRVAS